MDNGIILSKYVIQILNTIFLFVNNFIFCIVYMNVIWLRHTGNIHSFKRIILNFIAWYLVFTLAVYSLI